MELVTFLARMKVRNKNQRATRTMSSDESSSDATNVDDDDADYQGNSDDERNIDEDEDASSSDADYPVYATLDPEDNPYLQLRAARMKKNFERMLSLGLTPLTKNNPREKKSSAARPSISSSTVSRARKTPPATSAPKRKSPRIAAKTIDLTATVVTGTTRTSPRLAALNINSPTAPGNEEAEAMENEEVIEDVIVSSVARRRLWTSEMGKQTHRQRKAKLKQEIDEYGAMKILHPTKLSTVLMENGLVKEESREVFKMACDAFVRHHAEFNCVNYQKKSYRTKCNCLGNLLRGENSKTKMKQVCESLWEFFTRTKETQKLVLKEWFRCALSSGTKYKRNVANVCFILPGVFHDAPVKEPPEEGAVYNKQPFKICQNAVSVLVKYGFQRINSLKKQMNIAGLKEHGLKNKMSNHIRHNEEKHTAILDSLGQFFEKLKDEAEPHATRIVCEATGVGLRDKEIDSVELPSSMSKRRLYYRYLFQRGYKVKSDAKGRMPNIKNFPIRDTFDDDWPQGSEPLPVCSWYYFRQYWKTNYPKMMIRPPSHDTCAECWRYKNHLGITSRLTNNENRKTMRSNLGLDTTIAELEQNEEEEKMEVNKEGEWNEEEEMGELTSVPAATLNQNADEVTGEISVNKEDN